MEIGFTRLEAAIYISLARETGATGYKIAKIIGKPVPNTYKALESLQSKGAIISDGSGKSRLYSALPISVYLDHIEKDFKTRRSNIEDSLKNLEVSRRDEGIYRLENVEQVFELTRDMLKSAERLVLVDAFPKSLAKIKKDLKKLAKRGVIVVIQAFDEDEIDGCVVLNNGTKEQMELLPGEWFNVIVDAEQYILAFLDKDIEDVYEAVWTKSPFVSLVMFNGLMHEFVMRRTWIHMAENKSTDEICSDLGVIMKNFTGAKPALEKLYSYHSIESGKKPDWPNEDGEKVCRDRENGLKK